MSSEISWGRRIGVLLVCLGLLVGSVQLLGNLLVSENDSTYPALAGTRGFMTCIGESGHITFYLMAAPTDERSPPRDRAETYGRKAGSTGKT